MRPLVPLFCISRHVSSGFQSQSGFSGLHASLPVCNGLLSANEVAAR